jgi:hypothetical protein
LQNRLGVYDDKRMYPSFSAYARKYRGERHAVNFVGASLLAPGVSVGIKKGGVMSCPNTRNLKPY